MVNGRMVACPTSCPTFKTCPAFSGPGKKAGHEVGHEVGHDLEKVGHESRTWSN